MLNAFLKPQKCHLKIKKGSSNIRNNIIHSLFSQLVATNKMQGHFWCIFLTQFFYNLSHSSFGFAFHGSFWVFFNRLKFFKSQSEHMIQEEVYFQIREINLYQSKKSVKWHGLWRTLFRTSNIVSLCLGPYLKGECMNQKAKPQKQSLAVDDQNGIWVLGRCRFV